MIQIKKLMTIKWNYAMGTSKIIIQVLNLKGITESINVWKFSYDAALNL